MTSVQRFLPNARNLLREAVLSASSVATSEALRTLSVSRAGNGRVRLTGAYTGHEAATYDIEIASGGSTMRASTPVFAGVGNGTLAATAASGAPAETWTLTLVDLGTETTHAQLQVESVIVRAKTAGAAGNAVRLTVTPSLTQAATSWSLLDDWPAGEATLEGVEYDFGGLPLNAKGELDATTARIQFGTDYQVYRPYRQYKDGAWRYGITPAPARAIPAGTRVYAVSGGYSVTVTNGTTSNTYASLVTFYDLLAALAADPLVEVVGTVTADRQPGGMAMRDVPLRTASWVLSQSGVELTGVNPASDAPTETITVECLNADAVGLETWAVSGSLSGALGTATSGAAFTSDVIALTVPKKDGTVDGSGDYTTNYLPVARGDGEGQPSVIVRDVTLGINAKPGTYTFIYELTPEEDDCDATTALISGRVSPACLGLEGATMALDSNYSTRLSSLYGWRKTFTDGNVKGVGQVSKADLDLGDQVVALFADCLAEVYESSSGRTAWDSEWTQAQSDLSALATAQAYEYFTLTIETQGSYQYYRYYRDKVLVNPINGHQYLITSVQTSSVEQDSVTLLVGSAPHFAAGTTVWKTDGTSATYTNGSTTVTFLDKGTLTDLVAGSLASDQFADGSEGLNGLIEQLLRRYRARLDTVLIAAGIVPKSSASSTTAAGDGCWRDYPDKPGRWVEQNGLYFPAFSNAAYVSSKQSCGSGASASVPVGEPYSTKEFGFAIAVGCEERLKPGDKVTLIIGSVDGSVPYRVGDKGELKIVTGGAAYLAGGVDGDDTQTWSVVGSVSGTLADYEVPTDGTSIPLYTLLDAEVTLGTLQLTAGGIDYALGDRWVYDVEAGQFRWRKGAGAWSSLTDIAATVALSDGVSAAFTSGAAPSFVAGDAYQFRAEQPSAPSHVATPDDAVWAWTGSSATLTTTLPPGSINAIGIARHHLPEGATVTVEIGDGTEWEYSTTLDATRGVALVITPEDWSLDELVLIDADGAILGTELGEDITYTGIDTVMRLTVTGATGGDIGWLWIGDPLATTHHASTCRLTRQWSVARGAGINPARQYLGRGMGGEVAWDASGDVTLLTEADRDALLDMLDDLQETSEPLILVPHYLHPDEAALVDIQFDAIEMRDETEWQADSTARRMISMSIPLAAVIE